MARYKRYVAVEDYSPHEPIVEAYDDSLDALVAKVEDVVNGEVDVKIGVYQLIGVIARPSAPAVEYYPLEEANATDT